MKDIDTETLCKSLLDEWMIKDKAMRTIICLLVKYSGMTAREAIRFVLFLD